MASTTTNSPTGSVAGSVTGPAINSAPTCTANIGDMREQIIANAGVLYPHVTITSASFILTGIYNPKEVFEVLVRGGEAGSAVEAMELLLKAVSEALGWHTETLLGEIKFPQETEEGVVNYAMVQDGFHFVHSYRWAGYNADV